MALLASPTPDNLRQRLHGKRSRTDRAFKWGTLLAGAAVLAVLALIVITMSSRSTLVFREEGLDFLTKKRWAPAADAYGALGFIFGTAITSLIAVLLAVPVSLGIALFITQVTPKRWQRPIVALIDLVAVVPSAVFGLWGIIYLAPKLVGFYRNLHNWFGDWWIIGRIFGPASSGRTILTAGLILAVMIVPIITSISREVIDTTPQADRDGALALGATRWEMITGAVMPHSIGGITGAVMLGLGRAMGETIATALVIGSAVTITPNILSSGDSLPAVIAFQWGEATTDIKRSALIAMGLVLFLMTIVVNFLANWIVGRTMRRVRGVA